MRTSKVIEKKDLWNVSFEAALLNDRMDLLAIRNQIEADPFFPTGHEQDLAVIKIAVSVGGIYVFDLVVGPHFIYSANGIAYDYIPDEFTVYTRENSNVIMDDETLNLLLLNAEQFFHYHPLVNVQNFVWHYFFLARADFRHEKVLYKPHAYEPEQEVTIRGIYISSPERTAQMLRIVPIARFTIEDNKGQYTWEVEPQHLSIRQQNEGNIDVGIANDHD